MPKRQPLPHLWIVSDQRNDHALEAALRRVPRGSGLIFRHYHLCPAARRARFEALRRIARLRGHKAILSGTARSARAWKADGVYGSARTLSRGPAMLRLAAVHSFGELGRVGRADAVLLSPVFATRSHPCASTLGPLRFRLLAARARVPVIALGGMDPRRAHRLDWRRWAAIDSYIDKATRRDSVDS